MALTAKDVAEITRLLEESSFDELYLEIDGVKLSLRRGSPGAVASKPEPSAAQPVERSFRAAPGVPPLSPPEGPAPRPGTLTPSADGAVRDVPSPLLGTFYRAPKPGAAPFIDVGSLVEEQTIVGLIEVMKLMNTVRAGVRGRVTEILARDGVLVEYGETLLRVGRAS